MSVWLLLETSPSPNNSASASGPAHKATCTMRDLGGTGAPSSRSGPWTPAEPSWSKGSCSGTGILDHGSLSRQKIATALHGPLLMRPVGGLFRFEKCCQIHKKHNASLIFFATKKGSRFCLSKTAPSLYFCEELYILSTKNLIG